MSSAKRPPPTHYLPDSACETLNHLGIVAHAFFKAATNVCFDASETSAIQLDNTEEWCALRNALMTIASDVDVDPANRLVDIRWCRTHLEITKAVDKFNALISCADEKTVMIGEERLMKAIITSPQTPIVHQFKTMIEVGAQAERALKSHFGNNLTSITIGH